MPTHDGGEHLHQHGNRNMAQTLAETPGVLDVMKWLLEWPLPFLLKFRAAPALRPPRSKNLPRLGRENLKTVGLPVAMELLLLNRKKMFICLFHQEKLSLRNDQICAIHVGRKLPRNLFQAGGTRHLEIYSRWISERWSLFRISVSFVLLAQH